MGEVLKELIEEKFTVKAKNGPRYVVGCHCQLEKSKLKPGISWFGYDYTDIYQDPLVYSMSHKDTGNISFSEIGAGREVCVSAHIRELREEIELPLTNLELFQCRDNTSKRLFVIWTISYRKNTNSKSQLDCNFLKVVSSSIIDKYIGESAHLIGEMSNYARDHQPCIILMDKIDAIGGCWFSESTPVDRFRGF